MKTVRRFLLRHVVSAIAIVLAAFLALLFFLDMVNDLSNLGKPGFDLVDTLMQVALSMPSRAYEVLPIATLVGAVFALASLAESSEFTILRISGLSPRAALGLLLQLGTAIVLVLFLLGEVVAPAAAKLASRLHGAELGDGFGTRLKSGIWLRNDTAAQGNQIVNIGAISVDGQLSNVRLYVLDARAQIAADIQAASGRYDGNGNWTLQDVTRIDFPPAGGALRIQHVPTLTWQTTLSPSVLGVLLLSPDRMSLLDLGRYIAHLRANHQAAERFEIQFWKKLLYPFSAMVMLLLALPFAYLHTRAKGVSGKVFAGIVIGVAFILLNTLFSSLGLLGTWPPVVTAALPTLLFSALGLAAFAWQVRYR